VKKKKVECEGEKTAGQASQNWKKTVEILTDKQMKQGKGEVVPLLN
jgi:hypothetical protein